MAKRWLCAALFVALLFCSARAQDTNIVKNPSFEGGESMDGWAMTAWEEGDVYTSFELWDEGAGEGYSAVIINYEENDARFQQEIAVEGDTAYRFSARIKADGIGGDGTTGANLSVMDTFVSSIFIYDTDGEWIDVEFYGKTEKKQTSITIAARLGYYGGLCAGRAFFDDIQVTKLDPAEAAEYYAQSLKTNTPGASSSSVAAPDKAGVTYLVLAILFGFLAAFLFYRVSVKLLHIPQKAATAVLIGILAGAAAIRIAIAYIVPGYEVDMNCFAAWGGHLLSVGAPNFYSDGYFCDYPPGYMIVSAGLAAIANLAGLEHLSPPHQLLLKLPAIACDIALAYVIYRITVKHLKSETMALALAALYAFNTAVIGNSAAWGQIDSLLTLMMALSIYSMTQKKLLHASICFAVGLLFKPQALLFGPVLVLAFIGAIIENPKQGLKTLGISFGVCALLCLAVILPFNGGRSPLWILDLYMETVGSYEYASVNAMNLFGLLGGNWQPQENVPFLLSWARWGTIFMVLSIGYAALIYFRKREPRTLVLAAVVILAGVFAFGVRMHERYLFPALMLLLIAAALYEDRRFIHIFISYSMMLTVNIWLVLAHDHILTEDAALRVIFSLVTVATTLYLFYTAWRITARKPAAYPMERDYRPARMVTSVTLPTLHKPGTHSLRFTRVDALLLTAITIVYGVLAFYNLGDTDAPATTFRVSAADEAVVFDLGDAKDISTFIYYGEIAGGSFELSFSNDGVRFDDAVHIDYCNTDSTANIMFKWLVEDLGRNGRPVTARYAKLHFLDAGLTFFEVGLTDAEGAPYPLRVRERDGGRDNLRQDPNLLIDEQALIPARPTYMNSMYFDEIYHARTAYEHIHNMEWYESTHPPLGKVFMSWCVDLLGMNPFAWRLAGTLAGILMLPGMYLLGKLLFRRTELAFAVTSLMALDCMHFTQTRIATIDSFPVLFIIWAFFFMFLYARMSFFHERFYKTLIPLAASGIFMGLACASKWIGLYAAAGLAVVFVWVLVRRYLEYRNARKSGNEADIARTAKFWKYTALTCVFCVGFFLLIPAAIYYGSYYQYLRVPNKGHSWKGVWNYQTHMLNYHKAVFDDHPYESVWYQWPVIWKPMAFFFDYRMKPGWTSAISTFGNPAVWWAGLAAMIWQIARWVRGDARRDPRVLLVVIGFLAQYLPWVLVPRTTFIYHYFASVPFIILAIGFFLEAQLARGKKGRRVIVAYLIATAVVFALFYPVASGLEIPVDFAKLTAWLPSWHLYWGG